ncbi:MAG: PEP-CTERM sorting domain-containing protein [Terriglobales bacterium]
MRTASLSLLTILCLMLAVAPAMADTYSNGPINGTADGWTINFGFTASDSFTLGSFDTAVTAFHFNYWDASSTDLLTTADLQLGTTSFGGSATTVAFSNTFLGTNQYGYNLYQADATGLAIAWSGGAGYATLGNACTTSGCSVSTPIYWDENSGPSTAYENTIGSIPSESFTISGEGCGAGGPDCGPPVPEPSSIMLFGSGILGLAGILRRRLF